MTTIEQRPPITPADFENGGKVIWQDLSQGQFSDLLPVPLNDATEDWPEIIERNLLLQSGVFLACRELGLLPGIHSIDLDQPTAIDEADAERRGATIEKEVGSAFMSTEVRFVVVSNSPLEASGFLGLNKSVAIAGIPEEPVDDELQLVVFRPIRADLSPALLALNQ